MGWFFGLFMLLICAPLNLYTGILLVRLRDHHPTITTYGELGTTLFGENIGIVAYVFLYLHIFFLLGEYMIVMARSIQGIFYTTDICRPTAGIITMVILVISNQARTLRNIAILSVVSFVTIFIVLSVCLHDIVDRGNVSSDQDVVRQVSFWNFYGSFSTFVFAWNGQKIYLEIMSEMRNSRDFKKSLYSSHPIILILYIVVVSISYAHQGRETPGYILDALDFTGTKSFANLMMFFYMQISFTLNMQILSRAIHRRWYPETVNIIKRSSSMFWQAQSQWFMITSGITIATYLLSNLIPFFDDFVELVGSLLSPFLDFLFPCVFYLKTMKNASKKIEEYERVLIYCVITFGVSVVIFGTIASFRDLVHHTEEYGYPFDCFCESKSC